MKKSAKKHTKTWHTSDSAIVGFPLLLSTAFCFSFALSHAAPKSLTTASHAQHGITAPAEPVQQLPVASYTENTKLSTIDATISSASQAQSTSQPTTSPQPASTSTTNTNSNPQSALLLHAVLDQLKLNR